MKLHARALLSFSVIALTHGTVCYADLTPTPLPQATPPVINDQVKQVIQNQIQTPVQRQALTASTASVTAAAAPTTTTLPANLPAAMYGNGSAAANNLDNQRAYQAQIKQYLQTQKR